MKILTCTYRGAALALCLLAGIFRAPADTMVVANTYTELVTQVILASEQFENQGTYTIVFGQDITYDGNAVTSMFTLAKAGTPLAIDGNGHYLDMNSVDRAFFVVAGTVTFEDLEIKNAVAKGGDALGGAGGGLGAGGAIFIANGSEIDGAGFNLAPTVVAIRNVTFSSNQASGGSSSPDNPTGGGAGGGGLGGNGGTGYFAQDSVVSGGGGGGGIGLSGIGGSASNDPPAATVGGDGTFLTTTDAYSGSGSTGISGGVNGGGGGGVVISGGASTAYGGGGGGIYGEDGSGSYLGIGGDGGWGGGGGGGSYSGGDGGWGGGGGTGIFGGTGGFGGGGGATYETDTPSSSGGFGAGNGTVPESIFGPAMRGGGGLGAGGAIFAMKGTTVTLEGVTFSDNSVTGGSSNGGNDGLGVGADLFLGTDIVWTIAEGASHTFGDNSLGGGAFSQPGASTGADSGNDAKGSFTITGGGTIVFQGSQSFAGTTFIEGSSLVLAAAVTGSSPLLQGSSGAGSYQVGEDETDDGAALTVAASGSVISPILQNAGEVSISGDGNTIVANPFTPSTATSVVELIGGTFTNSGDNTTMNGSVTLSGDAQFTGSGSYLSIVGAVNLSDNAQFISTGVELTFGEVVNVGGGSLEVNENTSMNGLFMTGGTVILHGDMDFVGSMNINGGTFRLDGRLKPASGAELAFSGGESELIGGDDGTASNFTVLGTGKAAFAGNFENSSFLAEAPLMGQTPTIKFGGFDNSQEFQTVADSITVKDGASVYFSFAGNSPNEEPFYSVGAADVSFQNGAVITFDLYSQSTILLMMTDANGTLSFKQGFAESIEFALGVFGDSLAPGESRLYTLIDAEAASLDLDGQTDIFSHLVFNSGIYSDLSGTFSGLNPEGDHSLYLNVTRAIPEPSVNALIGLSLIVLALQGRQRLRGKLAGSPKATAH